MRRVVVLLLLLLPTAVHAQTASWHGELVGPSVAADAQVLDATLVALRVDLEDGAGSWVLEGERLEVVTRVEVSDPSVPPDPEEPGSALGPRVHEERGTHEDFLAYVSRTGAGTAHVFPHPDGGATLERSIGVVELVPSSDDVVDPGDRAPAHQWPHDTSRAVHVSDREPLQYVLRGDLLLDVESMDWVVEDRNGSAQYPSGQRTEPVTQPAGEMLLAREEDRHLFLYVRNGTLKVPGHGLRPELYLDHVRVESERTDLRAASGTLTLGGTTLELAGDAVEFRGASLVQGLRSSGRLLAYEVSGDGGLHVGGTLVQAAPEPAGGVVPVPVDANGAGAAWLLLAPLAWVLVRPPFWFVAVALRLRMRRFAARHAPRFLASRHASQAALVGAVALLGLRRFRQAGRFLDDVPEGARPRDGTWFYLHAHASAGAGADDEAAEHLERCLAAAPEHRQQVLANPVLRRVVRRRPERFVRLVAATLT